MKPIKILTVCLLITFLFNSCKTDFFCDCLEGGGSTKQTEYKFSKETGLTIKSAFDVYLINDTINKIIIEGGENLLKNVKITTDSTRLSISNNNVCNWARSYENIRLYIHTQTLKDYNNESPSRIVSTNTLKSDYLSLRNNTPLCSVNLSVDCDYFYFDHWNGSGEFTLKGRCTTFESQSLGTASSGPVWADSLKITNANIYTNSTGDYHLNVSNELVVKILWIGNVYYKGNPTVKIDTLASSGRPIKE